MYNIFFGKRRLALYNKLAHSINDPSAVLYSSGTFPDLAELPYLFWESPNINTLCVPSANEESTFEQLFTKLHHINAGGGLVTNCRGEFLLIFRYGCWDLPKGNQEPGEDISATALREVEEECGIGELEIGSYICNTYHTFHRDGRFNLKSTYWYHMKYTGQSNRTVPQASECIEQAIWVALKDLPHYLNNTYPSILEVFNEGL
ncbi:MAG: NUDIX domain-containing protein [Bacteroidales bacterium]